MQKNVSFPSSISSLNGKQKKRFVSLNNEKQQNVTLATSCSSSKFIHIALLAQANKALCGRWACTFFHEVGLT